MGQPQQSALAKTCCELGIGHAITEATTLRVQLWRRTLYNSSLAATFEVSSMSVTHLTEAEMKCREAKRLAPGSPRTTRVKRGKTKTKVCRPQASLSLPHPGSPQGPCQFCQLGPVRKRKSRVISRRPARLHSTSQLQHRGGHAVHSKS